MVFEGGKVVIVAEDGFIIESVTMGGNNFGVTGIDAVGYLDYPAYLEDSARYQEELAAYKVALKEYEVALEEYRRDEAENEAARKAYDAKYAQYLLDQAAYEQYLLDQAAYDAARVAHDAVVAAHAAVMVAHGEIEAAHEAAMQAFEAARAAALDLNVSRAVYDEAMRELAAAQDIYNDFVYAFNDRIVAFNEAQVVYEAARQAYLDTIGAADEVGKSGEEGGAESIDGGINGDEIIWMGGVSDGGMVFGHDGNDIFSWDISDFSREGSSVTIMDFKLGSDHLKLNLSGVSESLTNLLTDMDMAHREGSLAELLEKGLLSLHRDGNAVELEVRGEHHIKINVMDGGEKHLADFSSDAALLNYMLINYSNT